MLSAFERAGIPLEGAAPAIAGGRVWTGTDALKIGLVDKLGGLEQAIESAADRAKLDSFRVKTIEQEKTPQQQLLMELMNNAWVIGAVNHWFDAAIPSPLQLLLRPLTDSVDFLSSMNDPRGAYIYCSACIAP